MSLIIIDYHKTSQNKLYNLQQHDIVHSSILYWKQLLMSALPTFPVPVTPENLQGKQSQRVKPFSDKSVWRQPQSDITHCKRCNKNTSDCPVRCKTHRPNRTMVSKKARFTNTKLKTKSRRKTAKRLSKKEEAKRCDRTSGNMLLSYIDSQFGKSDSDTPPLHHRAEASSVSGLHQLIVLVVDLSRRIFWNDRRLLLEGSKESYLLGINPESGTEDCGSEVSQRNMNAQERMFLFLMKKNRSILVLEVRDKSLVWRDVNVMHIISPKVNKEWDADLCQDNLCWQLPRPLARKLVKEKMVKKFLITCLYSLLHMAPLSKSTVRTVKDHPKKGGVTSHNLVLYLRSNPKCDIHQIMWKLHGVITSCLGVKTVIPTQETRNSVDKYGVRSDDPVQTKKEEVNQHCDESLLQDALPILHIDEQPYGSLESETGFPNSRMRHDPDGSCNPESMPYGGNTDNPFDSVQCTDDIEMRKEPPLNPASITHLKISSAVSSPEDDTWSYDLISDPEETDCSNNDMVDISINTNIPSLVYTHETDQPNPSEDFMESAVGCLELEHRADTQSKQADQMQKEIRKLFCNEILENVEEMRSLMRLDEELCRARSVILSHEKALYPVPFLSSSSKEKREDKEKEKKSRNLGDIDDYSWTWQIPNISPGSRDIIVAMLKSPGRNSLPSLNIVHSGMENEWKRLITFAQFKPPAEVFVLRLAAAGFFLPARREGETPEQANVECAFCGVMVAIVDFVQRTVMELHRERSPRCEFVLGKTVGNVSVAQLTERSGQEFLHVLGSPFSNPGKSPRRSSSSPVAASTAPRPSRQPTDLAVDACPEATTAVDRPPTATPGHSVPPSGNPLLNTDSGKPLPPATPGQQARPAVAAVSSASAAAAAATRHTDPVSSAPSPGQNPSPPAPLPSGINEPDSTSRAGSSAPVPAPLQTARVEQPQAQAGNSTRENVPATSNAASSPANPPAANAAQVTDGASRGTATQEPPPSSAEEPSRQSGGNEGEGNRNSGEDRPQERQVVTYEELGIYTQQPKRQDMVVKAVRINTFESWPHTESHPAEEMAEAGFYFTGHEDLVRCFHCKGGLKTWERSDKPWVEHSRWFPRCPYVRLAKGQKFVDAVQKLNNPQTRPAISEEDVEREIRRMEDEERGNLGPDVMLFSSIPPPAPENDPTLGPLARTALRVDADITAASLAEMTEQLEDENEEMRDSIRCKMCQMNNVNVLFLPCGHLVACTQCAPALRRCAMCRAAVKGFVHVYMDDRRDRGNNAGDGNPGAGTQGTTA